MTADSGVIPDELIAEVIADEPIAPCPFCGGEARIVDGDESAYVQCTNVKMHRAIWFEGDNNAANEVREQWNRRVSPEADRADLVEREAAARVPAGYVLVPQVAIDWLNGAEPNERGEWFGDVENRTAVLIATGRKPGFWWRSEFRRICEALPAPIQPSAGQSQDGER